MLKTIIVALSLFVAVQSLSLAGGYVPSETTPQVLDLAKWSTAQLSTYTQVEGDHTVLSVRNVMTQVVAGINYKFTIDLLIATEDNKYLFKSCDVAIFEQSWSNTRKFIEAPKCGAHPNYPNF